MALSGTSVGGSGNKGGGPSGQTYSGSRYSNGPSDSGPLGLDKTEWWMILAALLGAGGMAAAGLGAGTSGAAGGAAGGSAGGLGGAAGGAGLGATGAVPVSTAGTAGGAGLLGGAEGGIGQALGGYTSASGATMYSPLISTGSYAATPASPAAGGGGLSTAQWLRLMKLGANTVSEQQKGQQRPPVQIDAQNVAPYQPGQYDSSRIQALMQALFGGQQNYRQPDFGGYGGY